MTLFFPDLNVWLALSVSSHSHCRKAWRWLNSLPDDVRLLFSRYTQIGLLRLLTNQVAMGEQTLTLRQAWAAYDRWLKDPRVEFYPEPRGLDAAFRHATNRLLHSPPPNGLAIATCWRIRKKAKLVWLPSMQRS
jgi:predicted nucleic acid-binding protein